MTKRIAELTPEELEKRREYQATYMRARRAAEKATAPPAPTVPPKVVRTSDWLWIPLGIRFDE